MINIPSMYLHPRLYNFQPKYLIAWGYWCDWKKTKRIGIRVTYLNPKAQPRNTTCPMVGRESIIQTVPIAPNWFGGHAWILEVFVCEPSCKVCMPYVVTPFELTSIFERFACICKVCMFEWTPNSRLFWWH